MVLASLNTVVEETVELLRPEIENRGQRLRTQEGPRIWRLAHFDPASNQTGAPL